MHYIRMFPDVYRPPNKQDNGIIVLQSIAAISLYGKIIYLQLVLSSIYTKVFAAAHLKILVPRRNLIIQYILVVFIYTYPVNCLMDASTSTWVNVYVYYSPSLSVPATMALYYSLLWLTYNQSVMQIHELIYSLSTKRRITIL